MRVIVAGSRWITDRFLVDQAIRDSGFSITELVSGCALGVDQVGESWARSNKVPVKRFPAQWVEQGRSAGVLRNQQMAEYADALVALWDGHSRGTKDMIERMIVLAKPVAQFTLVLEQERFNQPGGQNAEPPSV